MSFDRPTPIERVEYTDHKGRKYEVLKQGDMDIVVGPPEGLVDRLNLPEPLATNLHNVLFRRRIFNTGDIAKDPRSLAGALQEAINLDVQRLTEAFFNYEKEASHEQQQ